MKIPKLKIGDMLLIQWIDAHCPKPNAWATLEECDEQPTKMNISSLGFFIDKRDGYIRISGEFSGSEECMDVVNRIINIPIGCIESVVVLNPS
jgi:hypothetical protein